MSIAVEDVRRVAGEVPDPEIPVLTIAELGILRDVRVDESGGIDIDITPTYSGCPALDVIREDVQRRVAASAAGDVRVHVVLSPPWSSDALSEDARRKLREHGVAPPRPRAGLRMALPVAVACPVCGSARTEEVAHFAGTACQGLRRCSSCSEPFQHFKEH